MKSIANNLKEIYRTICTRYFLARAALINNHGRALTLLCGILLIAFGMMKIYKNVEAQQKDSTIVAQYQQTSK